MRWFSLALMLVAGCGGSNPRPTPTPRPAPAEATAVATPAGPWSEPVAGKRTPLPCPASSSRAGWASRVRALGGGRYVKLSGRRRLAAVDRDGGVLRRHALGARGDVRLACGRGGRLAVAWVEQDTLRLHAGGRTRTIDSASTPYHVDAISSFALAYAPDGTLLLAYAVPSEIRAVSVSPTGATGRPFRLGPASELSTVVADIARNGRAVVAWSTIDAGEERNERRRIYAVTGRPRALGPARLVERVRYLNISATSDAEIALALAPNGRALLAYAADRRAVGDLDYDEGVDAPMEVRVAEVGPRGGFRPSRRLAHTGRQASAAIRSDGTKLVAFDTDDGLRAFFGKRLGAREVVTRDERVRYPTASFTGAGRPTVEWQAGASTRTG